MQKVFFALVLCGGCISGGGAVVVHGSGESEPEASGNRVMRQVMRQDLWAQQALNSRPTQPQLDQLRSGRDPDSMKRARKELSNLFQAVDRATWIRDTISELMREDGDPRLAQEFDRAGRLRADALRAAGETADALIDGGAGLTGADLQPGYNAIRKAQASEDKIARLPMGPTYPRLAPSPLPVPSPLDRASAKLNGGGGGPPAVAALPPPVINNDSVRMHASAADAARQKEEQQRDADMGPPVEAAAPQTTLTIANDALDIITRKRPRSITLREDGLFDLSCADGEYLVGPDGKLVRKEAPSP
jgi:hypothetical protein